MEVHGGSLFSRFLQEHPLQLSAVYGNLLFACLGYHTCPYKINVSEPDNVEIFILKKKLLLILLIYIYLEQCILLEYAYQNFNFHII